jgi:hypothetical protein
MNLIRVNVQHLKMEKHPETGPDALACYCLTDCLGETYLNLNLKLYLLLYVIDCMSFLLFSSKGYGYRLLIV